MCSRYSLICSPQTLSRIFGRYQGDDFPPRYNIAPSQPVLIVRIGVRGEREFRLVRWGLIPSWAKDPPQYGMLVNARSETAAEKPSFRGAMRHRRCLIPTTGYYEWTGGRSSRQPHLIKLDDQPVFAMAGLWEAWLGADGSEIETMAILTTAANADVVSIHDRMPVVIEPEHYDRWLDCSSGRENDVVDLMAPLPRGRMTVMAINPKLNDPRAEGPDLHQPPNPTLL
jgi:putative SOS response-associated peptidase YedK